MRFLIKGTKSIDITVWVLFVTLLIICLTNGILAVLFMYSLIIIFSIKNNKCTLMFFLYMIIEQNIIMVLSAPFLSSKETTLLCLGKEIMIYMSILIAIIKRISSSKVMLKVRNIKLILSIIILFVLIVLSFFSSKADIKAKIVSIRTIMLPFICLLFGYFVNVRETDIREIIKKLGIMGSLITIMAIIDLVIFKDQLLVKLPLKQFLMNKGIFDEFYWTGLPTNYTTWDYVSITGGLSYRLVSIFTEPLAMGHFCFGVMVLMDSIRYKYKKEIQFILLIGALLTLSKGIYISIIVWIGLKIICRLSFKGARNIVFLGFIAAISLAMIIPKLIDNYYSDSVLVNSSTFAHLNGLINGSSQADIIGRNLGKAGSVTYMLQRGSETIPEVDVVENWIGAYVYQLGYIAVIVFFVFFATHIIRLLKNYFKTDNKFIFSTFALLCAVIIESFLSDSSISIIGTGFYFVFAGIASRFFYKRERVQEMM